MTRIYPRPIRIAAFALLGIMALMGLAAYVRGEEPCGVATEPGTSCIWPGFVAAEDAQGQGYRRTYVLLLVSGPHDIDPEYYVNPDGFVPQGLTWFSVFRFTDPATGALYTERLVLDVPKSILQDPAPRTPRLVEPR